MFGEYACAILGIPQALPGMANALATALPWRNGPPNAPDGLRVSAMRQGVTGTKLKPVSAASPINGAKAVLPMPRFIDMATGVRTLETGVAVGEGLVTGVGLAKARGRSVDVGLAVPTAPPQPATENTMRDKQIDERIPENQNESWRRIDYLLAI